MLVCSPDSYHRVPIALAYITKGYNAPLAYSHIFVDKYHIKHDINTPS